MTVVSRGRILKSPATPSLRTAVALWLTVVALAAVSAGAQDMGDAAIGFEWAVAPENLGPGSAFTLDGTVTIDPESEGGPVAWSLTVGPVSDVTIDDADCAVTAGTSCTVDVDDGIVTFTGTVEDDPFGEVTADVVLTGTIDDRLDRDTILFRAETCGQVAVIEGTPEPGAVGRLPARVATPETACDGVEGAIEVTVAPATEVPTATPTATTEPTPTEEPTATATPPEEPTATAESTATATPTEEPTAAAEPTEAPTATAEATEAPTVPPTQEPTATPTEAPQVTPEEDDDNNTTGLWIGAGSLLVLTGAAATVLHQRRKIAA